MKRRSFLTLLGAAPLAGKAVADQAATSLGTFGALHPAPSSGEVQGMATPHMAYDAARRLILSDAKVLAEIRAELAEAELRSNPYIDPDIQIMRSWSPMAKVTFQRQRNVERALAEAFDNRLDRPNRYIRAIEVHMKKLMWGD